MRIKELFRSLVVALLVVWLVAAHPPKARVKTGFEVLIEQDFAPLKGMRVGLTEDRRRIIDVLARPRGVKLAAILAPEHGLEGTRDDRNIGDTVDRLTGVPVFSLYNEGPYRPTPEILKDTDALVCDIPRNGARFLPRITTLGYTLEAAAKHRILYFVLDRPNGISGVDVSGPLLD